MDFIEVEITNWAKHQRKDVKRPSWFALDNRILEDSKLFGLTDSEWKALIYVFSQASQQQSEIVRLNLAHADRVCQISANILRSCLKKLEEAGVTQTVRARNVDVTSTARERNAHVTPQDKTRQDNTEQNTIAGLRPNFDFEDLYRKYPRKEGKQKGIQKLKASIKLQKDFDACSLAIDRYRAKVVADAIEPRFIKHFSSFAQIWRDWCDPETGTVLGVVDQEAEFKRREKEILDGAT